MATERQFVTVDVRMTGVWESYDHSPGFLEEGDLVMVAIGRRNLTGRVVRLEPLQPLDLEGEDEGGLAVQLPAKADASLDGREVPGT